MSDETYKITYGVVSLKNGKRAGSKNGLNPDDVKQIIMEKEERGYKLQGGEVNVFEQIEKMKNPLNCKHGEIDECGSYCRYVVLHSIESPECANCSEWKLKVGDNNGW